MHKYEVVISWSDEDGVFIAEAPELPYCMTHGDTPQSALAELEVAMDLYIASLRKHGDPIPEPKTRVPLD